MGARKTNVLNVALFENRHRWPSNVTEYMYSDKYNYDPRDFATFEGLATIKLLQWKAEGVVAINLYLSGLIGATIAAINAAHSVGIYVKLFHYSNLTNKWIPQLLDFMTPPSGIILITEEDVKAEEAEERIKKSISYYTRRLIVAYVDIFNNLYNHYNPDRFTWEDVYSYITREYINYDKELLLLMKPYFENYKKEPEESEENLYATKLRRIFEARANANRLYEIKIPIHKSSNKRRNWRKYY